MGGTNANITLGDVNTIRILSSASPSWLGDVVAATLNVDNIRAATSLLNTNDRTKPSEFRISPNPGRNSLNLKLSQLDHNTTIEVFDVLGKMIYADRISDINKTVDVSQWNNGVYLVRLNSDLGSQTKRFVKQ